MLQVSQESGFWYQKSAFPLDLSSSLRKALTAQRRALLSTELESIFASAPQAPNSAANARIRDAYAKATGKAISADDDAAVAGKKRLPAEGDDCPVCYEALHGVSEASLVFCVDCGNAVHVACFKQCADHVSLFVTFIFYLFFI